MKYLAFALLAAVLFPAIAQAQQAPQGDAAQQSEQPPQAVDAELPPGMGPAEPPPDYLLEDRRPEGPASPPRIFASIGGGVSVRIVQDLDFAQDRFAPAYVDLFGAFVFGSAETWRHGVGLGVALNATGDGSATLDLGPEPFEQVVLTPSYLAYFRFGRDLALFGKAGVSVALSPELSGGLEIGGGAVYYLTAGLGLYAEVSASGWLGADNTLHPMVSAEGGLVIDYEVLP